MNIDTPIDTDTPAPAGRYLEPGPWTRGLLNPLISGLTKLGIGVWGSRVLEVRGRVSGEWRAVPVNPLPLEGHRYLVAPRGETQWVRNLRVAGDGRLRKGRRTESIDAVEIVDEESKLPILRAYLSKWAFEVGQFFDGITAESADDELLAAAPGFPVFRIVDRPR